MERSHTTRGSRRPRNTIREINKKNLEINNLDRTMVMDITLWENLTRVANPT